MKDNILQAAAAPTVAAAPAPVVPDELSIAAKREAETTKNIIESGRKNIAVVPYVPASDCPVLGTAIPLKLAYSTIYSLNSLEEKLGMAATDYVKEKLKYNSRLFVCESFAAEQVDALALAIYQVEQGKAFILGDFAGIGKGRVNAGLLRYAHHKGLIPVFATKDSSLFTDIYSDLYDIGGFSNEAPSVKKLPLPFILNGGVKIMSPLNREEDILFSSYDRKETIKICQSGQVPAKHKVTLFTYSQIGGDTEDEKLGKNKKALIEFLTAIAPNALFVLDESHCCAGESSWVGSHMKKILDIVNACTFSSATYAKSPETMRFYASKTDLAESPVSMDKIIDAAHSNGEVIQEYIANKLVKGGQMIRRERSYDGCDINSSFVGLGEVEKLKYYNIYDGMIKAFNKISAVKNSEYIKSAIKLAVEKYAKENGIKAVEKPFFESKEDAEDWKSRNAKNFTYVFLNTQTTGTGRSQWIDALLFSLKADFVADMALESMRTKYKVEYNDASGVSVKEVNRKPVVFLKNTGDSLLDRLGYKADMVITKEQGDFSQSLLDMATRLIVAKLRFERVDGDLSATINIENVDISEFLSDKGATITAMRDEFSKLLSGIPLSPIDHIINKIQNEKRESWDNEYSSSPTYLVEDTTKRGLMLVQRNDGTYLVAAKPKEDATLKFARFNSGMSDVAIINAASSTGISIHAKYSFKDKRQRIALIHQVELDVNTEVQKRGRINRSGQVCKPAYRYIVTVIPTEIRKLISLSRKLRSLDANTSGNMKQSSKMSSFVGSDGNPVEDIFNKYGYQALEEFCSLPENADFASMFNSYKDETKRYKGTGEDKIKAFTGKIEVITSARQEYFYNSVNNIYLEIRKRHIESDTWDLDIDIVDLRATTRTKKILMKGNSDNIFSGNVYFEDKYTSIIVKTMTKEALDTNSRTLALKLDTSSKKLQDAQDTFVDTYKKYIEHAVAHHTNAMIVPVKQEYESTEDYEFAKEQYEFKKQELEDSIRSEKKDVMNMMLTFKPMMPTMVYVDVIGAKAFIEKYISDNVDYEDRFADFHRSFAASFDSKPARFLGLKIYAKDNNSLISSNIAFVFAPLNTRTESIEINPTELGVLLLRLIVRTNEWNLPQKMPIINEWKIEGRVRENSRMLTGDLLTALSIADSIIADEKRYAPRKAIIQFTNSDGGSDVGIRLYPKSGTKFAPIVSEKKIDLNTREFINYVEAQGDKGEFVIIGNNYFNYDSNTFDVYISAEDGKYKSPYNSTKILKEIQDSEYVEFEEVTKFIKLPEDSEAVEHKFHFASFAWRSIEDVLNILYKHQVASIWIDEEAGVQQIAAINSEDYLNFIAHAEREDEELYFNKGDFTVNEYDSLFLFLTVNPKNRQSKFANGDVLNQLVELVGSYESVTRTLTYPDASKRTKAQVYRFQLSKELMKKALGFIFSLDKIYLPLSTSDYVIYKQEDVAGTDKADKEGEYKYILSSPLTQDNKHPEFIRHENLKGTPYGLVVLRYIISAIEASQYRYVPYNISIQTSLRNLNAVLFSDEDRERLYKFAQENKNKPDAVGREVVTITKIPVKFIFGNNKIEAIGKIIIDNFVPMKTSESENRADTKEEVELEPITLQGIRDAENYLLKIKSLI